MAKYTDDSIARVKEAVDMVALVGQRTDLRRVGSRWTGLCPFHDERTPSFSVNADDKLYHCFGCGESGDAIRFVQETEGVDFREALERLAERTNVELKREQEDPEAERRRTEQDRLRALLSRAAQFYESYLWKAAEAAPAREYLAERGLGEAVVREFAVGYAPGAGDKLISQAAKAGNRPEDLVGAGLARRRNGQVEDAFRGRLIFPLADQRGRVLGFAGRALRDGQQPKYLNTSENRAVGFHKGQMLYGMHNARAAAMKAGRFVVVEGYTDVLALHQAGIPEVVAIMGTALTDDQLKELTRGEGMVYLALDADNAGKQATFRASGMAEERNAELRVVAMPGGRDPAEIIAEDGPEAFRALLEAALTVPEFQVRRVLEQSDLSNASGRERALERVLPVLQSAPPITRNALIPIAADKVGLDPRDIEAQLPAGGRIARRPSGGDAAAPRSLPPVRPVAAVERAERVFLALCLQLGDFGREYLQRSSPEHFATDLMREARRHLLTHPGDPLSGLTPAEQSLATAVMEIVQMADEGPVVEQALRLSYLQLELRRVERDLRNAEQRSDFERQRSLWGERELVRGEISDLMGQTA
jgi:DNA primase